MKQKLKKKVAMIASIVLLVLISYQIYFHRTNKANTLLIVDSYDNNLKDLAILYVNDKKIDTVNFNEYYPYKGNHNFYWGENKITIQGIENESINYETTINYIGLYTWNVVQYRPNSITWKRHYLQPQLR